MTDARAYPADLASPKRSSGFAKARAAASAAKAGPRKRSVLVAGHRTSVSLEQPFWDALARIARGRGLSVNSLIAEIDRGRTGNLSSSIRVFVLAESMTGE